VPSSTQFRATEVSYRLNDCQAVAVVTTRDLAIVVDEVRAACPSLRHVIVTDEGGETVSGDWLDFTRLVEQGDESVQSAPTQSDDIAFLLYTSGTTGDPKGVAHCHRYPSGYESLVRYWHNYRPGDIVACPSEMGWGLPVASTFLYALAHRLTVVLFDPQG